MLSEDYVTFPSGAPVHISAKTPLEKTIEITCRDCATVDFQEVCAVPPGMNDSGWKHDSLTGAQKKRLFPTLCGQRSTSHDPFLALVPVDVGGRPF